MRGQILSGALRPGDRLPTERELARQMGVSRVTVRDAVRTLETARLVEVRVGAGGGPFVTHPPLEAVTESLGTHLRLRGTTFLELAEVRQALEVRAVRLACERASADDLVRLRALAERPGGGRSAAETAEQSVDFHVALVAATQNGALLAMFLAARSLLQEAFDVLHARQPDMVEVASDVHRRLVGLIETRKVDQAAALMREHQLDFMERAERAAGEAILTDSSG